jgi:hypothetical protein
VLCVLHACCVAPLFTDSWSRSSYCTVVNVSNRMNLAVSSTSVLRLVLCPLESVLLKTFPADGRTRPDHPVLWTCLISATMLGSDTERTDIGPSHCTHIMYGTLDHVRSFTKPGPALLMATVRPMDTITALEDFY